MKLEEYAWNKHEQKLKSERSEFKYTASKIKILDCIELRNEIEEALENLPQKLLARWALKVASKYLDYLDSHLKNDPRIQAGIENLEKRIEGKIGTYELRKIGFDINKLAQESKSDLSKYSARSFTHAIATGHMRGHALVSSDYAIKATNLMTNNSLEDVILERKRQLKIIDELLETPLH